MRFPKTASSALTTWSAEQEKSVKSPMERGMRVFTREMGAMACAGGAVGTVWPKALWRGADGAADCVAEGGEGVEGWLWDVSEVVRVWDGGCALL
jgi:hypothetical protein